MQISKSQVEVYKIRGLKHGAWADITIDANGTTGRISIASDYGSWERYWGACGCSFKEFLCDLDIHYTAGKFGVGNSFDVTATIHEWKRHVFDDRRNEYIDAEKARELYDEINRIGDEAPGLEGVKYMLWNSDHLMNFFGGTPPIQTTIDRSFVRFWDEVWTPFKQELKKEFESELQVA